jgi:hypothetical protein
VVGRRLRCSLISSLLRVKLCLFAWVVMLLAFLNKPLLSYKLSSWVKNVFACLGVDFAEFLPESNSVL